jgi:hypothetical protein
MTYLLMVCAGIGVFVFACLVVFFVLAGQDLTSEDE